MLPDRETVRAVMKRPSNFLSQVLASPDYGIFAREHFEGDRQRFKDQLISTGPFMVTRSEVGRGYATVRHPATIDLTPSIRATNSPSCVNMRPFT